MFHEKIKELRIKKGVTGECVANAVGLSESAYRNYERGVREPNFATLTKLADFYGVTTDYLLGREEQPNPLALLNNKVDDDKFIELYSTLPDYAKEIFVDTMAKLAQAQKEHRKKHVVRTGDLFDDEQAEETDAG